jgi:hypothetical protein
MRVVIAFAVALGAAWPSEAAACPPDAAARAAEIDGILARERKRARRWDLGWAATFGTLSVAQAGLALAEWTPLGEFDEAAEASLWIGASKAAIGSLSRLVLRLKIPRGGGEADPCERLASSESALREARRNQKRTFFLNHAGSLALNVTGLVILGLRYDSWTDGIVSFGLGYPVGLLSSYTQPRYAWHVRVVASPDVRGVALAGSW